jgi:hypothetical protein
MEIRLERCCLLANDALRVGKAAWRCSPWSAWRRNAARASASPLAAWEGQPARTATLCEKVEGIGGMDLVVCLYRLRGKIRFGECNGWLDRQKVEERDGRARREGKQRRLGQTNRRSAPNKTGDSIAVEERAPVRLCLRRLPPPLPNRADHEII